VLIVGDGPYEPQARRIAAALCPGRVVFRPYATDDDFAHYIAAADVIALPRLGTQAECSGVMVQAMAAGRAIVAHDLGCFREYLGGGRGILVPPGDVTALRDSIHALLTDPTRRTRHGEAARAYARDHLAWDRIAARHVELYAGLLGESQLEGQRRAAG
jgi:glycosyltransferase involved in cell wall biosynthesis